MELPQELREQLMQVGIDPDLLVAWIDKTHDGRPITLVEMIGEVADVALQPSDQSVERFDELFTIIATGIMARSSGRDRVFRVLEDRSIVWITLTRSEWMDKVLPVMLHVAGGGGRRG